MWAQDSTPERPRPFCPRCDLAAGPGASRAPLRLDAVDAASRISVTVRTLEATTREVLGDGPASQVLTRRDLLGKVRPTAVLRALIVPSEPDGRVVDSARYLARQADRIAAIDDLADVAVDELRYARAVLRAAVGTTDQVRPLAAPCPICDTFSLRAFLTSQEVIACTNAACRCDRSDCGCHDGTQHRWRYHPDPRYDQWQWLALILEQDLNVLLEDEDEDQAAIDVA